MFTSRFFLLISILGAIVAPQLAVAEDCARAARITDEVRAILDSNPALAEQKMREAISYCPRSASLQYNLGVALHLAGKNREAAAALNEALRLKPGYSKAMNTLAAVLYQNGDSGDYDKALALSKKAAELEPMNRQYRDTLESINAFVDKPPQSAMNNPDAIAVVIGNKTYRSESVPAVEYADNDAETVKKYLVESLGFREANIMLFQNATYTDLLKLFGDGSDHKGLLYNRTKQGRSDIFVFYSGHGAPDTNSRKAYLAPADLDPFAVKHTAYSLDLLYDNLGKLSQEKNPKSMTLVIDACFSGASNKGMIIKDASPIMLEISTPLLMLKDAAVFTSSQGNQISSWYPEQKHGLFTYYFLKSIRDAIAAGKPLTTGALAANLLGPDSVNDAALRLYNREQMPQITGSRDIVLTQ